MIKQLRLVLILIFITSGCSSDYSMREVFTKVIEKDKNVSSYSILKQHEESNTGFIFYQSQLVLAENENKQKVNLRIFDKHHHEWKLIDTASCNEIWNITTEEDNRNIYCGTINDPTFTKVLIDDKESTILNLKENHSKAWFLINKYPNSEIKVIRKDGKEEILQPGK